MASKTDSNLAHAFAAESKASARNSAFAQKADAEGYEQIGRLFRAVAEAEAVHARRFLMYLRGKIGTTEENLETAFSNEIKANSEEYPKLIQEAEEENRGSLIKALAQARDVEDRHAELYKKAMTDMLSETKTGYHVCQVCGYVAENKPSETCPICGAIKSKFKAMD